MKYERKAFSGRKKLVPNTSFNPHKRMKDDRKNENMDDLKMIQTTQGNGNYILCDVRR